MLLPAPNISSNPVFWPVVVVVVVLGSGALLVDGLPNNELSSSFMDALLSNGEAVDELGGSNAERSKPYLDLGSFFTAGVDFDMDGLTEGFENRLLYRWLLSGLGLVAAVAVDKEGLPTERAAGGAGDDGAAKFCSIVFKSGNLDSISLISTLDVGENDLFCSVSCLSLFNDTVGDAGAEFFCCVALNPANGSNFGCCC